MNSQDAVTDAIGKALMRFADRVLDDVLRALDDVQYPLKREQAEHAIYALRQDLRRELVKKND